MKMFNVDMDQVISLTCDEYERICNEIDMESDVDVDGDIVLENEEFCEMKNLIGR